jgi:hypothetical protein
MRLKPSPAACRGASDHALSLTVYFISPSLGDLTLDFLLLSWVSCRRRFGRCLELKKDKQMVGTFFFLRATQHGAFLASYREGVGFCFSLAVLYIVFSLKAAAVVPLGDHSHHGCTVACGKTDADTNEFEFFSCPTTRSAAYMPHPVRPRN